MKDEEKLWRKDEHVVKAWWKWENGWNEDDEDGDKESCLDDDIDKLFILNLVCFNGILVEKRREFGTNCFVRWRRWGF